MSNASISSISERTDLLTCIYLREINASAQTSTIRRSFWTVEIHQREVIAIFRPAGRQAHTVFFFPAFCPVVWLVHI